MSGPLDLDLQAIVRHPAGSSTKATNSVNHGAISPILSFPFKIQIQAGVVAPIFDPSTQADEGRWILWASGQSALLRETESQKASEQTKPAGIKIKGKRKNTSIITCF